VALLRKMTCNLRHPMGLLHPVAARVGYLNCKCAHSFVDSHTNKPYFVLVCFATETASSSCAKETNFIFFSGFFGKRHLGLVSSQKSMFSSSSQHCLLKKTRFSKDTEDCNTLQRIATLCNTLQQTALFQKTRF